MYSSAFASGDNPNGPDFQIDLDDSATHWVEFVLTIKMGRPSKGPF